MNNFYELEKTLSKPLNLNALNPANENAINLMTVNNTNTKVYACTQAV